MKNFRRTFILIVFFAGFIMILQSCNRENPVNTSNQNEVQISKDIPSGHVLSVFVRMYWCQVEGLYSCAMSGHTVYIKKGNDIILEGVSGSADEEGWVNFDPDGGLADGTYIAYCPGIEGYCGQTIFTYNNDADEHIVVLRVDPCK